MVKLIFEDNCEHAVTVVESGSGYDLPIGATSMFLPRYILVEGQVVDRYAGKDEEQARELFSQLQAEREAASLAAEQERLLADRAVISRLAYLRRFTQAERIAIAASDDPVVKDFMTMIQLAEHIDLSDPDTIAGTTYIEHEGFLSAGRAGEILTVIA